MPLENTWDGETENKPHKASPNLSSLEEGNFDIIIVKRVLYGLWTFRREPSRYKQKRAILIYVDEAFEKDLLSLGIWISGMY